MDSHACPICSTVGTAIVTISLAMALVPVTSRLEVFRFMTPIPLVVFRNVAPRAPPAT